MKHLTTPQLSMVQGGAFSFSGGGGRGRWGSYGSISGGYTFNPHPNVSVSPNITVTKPIGGKPKITGVGINVSIKF